MKPWGRWATFGLGLTAMLVGQIAALTAVMWSVDSICLRSISSSSGLSGRPNKNSMGMLLTDDVLNDPAHFATEERVRDRNLGRPG